MISDDHCASVEQHSTANHDFSLIFEPFCEGACHRYLSFEVFSVKVNASRLGWLYGHARLLFVAFS
jgi:hypothetical protein